MESSVEETYSSIAVCVFFYFYTENFTSNTSGR